MSARIQRRSEMTKKEKKWLERGPIRRKIKKWKKKWQSSDNPYRKITFLRDGRSWEMETESLRENDEILLRWRRDPDAFFQELRRTWS
jgi:hypothetical protein